MAPEYKLNYFDFRGMGETIRLIFTYAKVKFENRRFTFEEWPSIKPGSPFGHAPWLEYNGQKLAESAAIYRFLARKYGLDGNNDWDEAQIDALFDAYIDFGESVKPYFLVMFGQTRGDKEKLYQDMAAAFYVNSKILERYLDDAKNGFLFSCGLTWVDFFVSEFNDTLNGFHPELYKDHPKLLEHSKKVHSLPELQEYLKTRPVRPN